MHYKKIGNKAASVFLSLTLAILASLSVLVVGFGIWACTVPDGELKEELFAIGVADLISVRYGTDALREGFVCNTD